MNRYFPAMMPKPDPNLLLSFSIRLCILAAALCIAIAWVVRTTPHEYYLPLAWGALLLVLALHFGVWLWKRTRQKPQ
jgi:type VI protein secretion system component VasK